ncbi:iron ABC transporter permease [Clostridium tertium]|jgi:iron complex transport system permease protein|uniref:FecCD family ABC transporter permease n=1 Tax=Clostridium TaxID=1485 RepID=UPI001AE916C7|nr:MULTISPECIES: iron ABC transporter permease [Clostridium]MBP1869049.1 iron complex transport system permease protein [Clostridium tertium]MBS5308311.1 iron ABC transporter permease [Clostridium sp.]MDB1923555.1 iron ABC transporter permease [Clostridium tertium]MDB1927036.1 iron ABC transporter permease [Clostridium tertium]MDB1930756.1 iron ABC transporter permease [Clostridium tertium]
MKNLNKKFLLILIICLVGIVSVTVLSVRMGTKSIPKEVVFDAIFNFDESNVDHIIIRNNRLPRSIAVLVVGGFLAVAGSIMQGITRNYLASPSLMGVNDGSAFLITIAMVFYPGLSNGSLILVSIIGSVIGAVLVLGIGSSIKNGLSPVRLAIIGTIVGSFLSSLGSAIAMYFQVSQSISSWYNTKVHTVNSDLLKIIMPIGVIGIIVAIIIAKDITISSLGEDIAISLGQRTNIVKYLSMGAVVLLTATSVALVGKIAFVGLVIPNITRMIVGHDYKYIIPYSLIGGAFFLGLCDLLSRYIAFPFETPIGTVTAIIGVPFFLYMIKTKGGSKDA